MIKSAVFEWYFSIIICIILLYLFDVVCTAECGHNSILSFGFDFLSSDYPLSKSFLTFHTSLDTLFLVLLYTFLAFWSLVLVCFLDIVLSLFISLTVVLSSGVSDFQVCFSLLVRIYSLHLNVSQILAESVYFNVLNQLIGWIMIKLMEYTFFFNKLTHIFYRLQTETKQHFILV